MIDLPIDALLLSNSGQPYLAWAIEAIRDLFAGQRRIGFVSAATLGDPEAYWERVRATLEPHGFDVVHLRWDAWSPADLAAIEGVFVGGGNTYALLQRLRASGLLGAIRRRARRGLPYLGSSAGSNVAGPTILTTNDWNVVGLRTFRALGLVPFNINPHYLDVDPLMAPGSETRDDRIREYHVVNGNPVVGIEEGAYVRVRGGQATAGGTGRVKVFRRDAAPVWHRPGERLDLAGA